MSREPTIPEQDEALRRILSDTTFRGSNKLCELLQFVCNPAHRDRPEELSERSIGHHVFDRAEDYDAANDNIVRVQVRNLRARLERYYRGAGKDDPVLLRVPKGCYVPQFVYTTDLRADVQAAVRWLRPRALRWPALAFALLAALLVGVAIGRSGLGGTTSKAAEPQALSPPWSELLTQDHETLIVLGDAVFGMTQRLLGRSLSLEDYLSAGVELQGRPRAAVPADLTAPHTAFMRHITWRELVALSDLKMSSEIVRLAAAKGRPVAVHFARRLHASDLRGKNVILLGTARANPWVKFVEARSGFSTHYDDASGTPYFRVRSPLAGERETYRRGGADGLSEESYAMIGLYRNVDGHGSTLWIAGADDSGMDAATKLLMTPKRIETMVADLQLQSDGRLLDFEVLLKTSRIEGVSSGCEFVVHRVYAASSPDAAALRLEQ